MLQKDVCVKVTKMLSKQRMVKQKRMKSGEPYGKYSDQNEMKMISKLNMKKRESEQNMRCRKSGKSRGREER